MAEQAGAVAMSGATPRAWGALLLLAGVCQAQTLPLKTTFVPLGPLANAMLIEPVTPTDKSAIAVLITHPEHLNNFNYFTGLELPKYGYRAMMLNYYGKEDSYDEFLQPIAAAIRALRAIPGVQKVVLTGHSSGTAELSFYQDAAENGAAACQGTERVYKCQAKALENLPKADGLMMAEANTGAIEKVMSLNPAVGDHHPGPVDSSLDMFAQGNGYDAAHRTATYSAAFLEKFFKAQGAKSNRVIEEAVGRLRKIEQGQGEFLNDEPFLVAGAGTNAAGARIELADDRLMARTHAPHPLLKADGSVKNQVIPRIPEATRPQYRNQLDETSMNTTVRHYLSFRGLLTTAAYRASEDNVLGVQWRSTANSMQGNLMGVHVPTLLLAGSCHSALVLQEIGYDLSAAADKEFVAVEGADHFYRPCKPEYGDTYRRAFNYMDGWLSKPGRFLAR
jgi:pimeloyl-ACP methyl ester carboxylesterase